MKQFNGMWVVFQEENQPSKSFNRWFSVFGVKKLKKNDDLNKKKKSNRKRE